MAENDISCPNCGKLMLWKYLKNRFARAAILKLFRKYMAVKQIRYANLNSVS